MNMTKKGAGLFAAGLAVIAMLAVAPAAKADFSGDMKVTIQNPEGKEVTQVGKVFLQGEPDSPERVARMEMTTPGQDQKMVFLSNPKNKNVFMLMPEAKTYFSMSMEEGRTKAPSAPGEGLSPSDFKTVGKERVGGRSTIVKEAPLEENGKSTGTVRVWVAPDLNGEAIKSEVRTDEGTVSSTVIENPSTKSLPDSLFRVPKGYTEAKLPSMGTIMEGTEQESKKQAGEEAKQEQKEAEDEAVQKMREELPF